MCDKPFPQQKLASQLAEPIISILDNPRLKSKLARQKASLAYLSTFWKTMVRELPGIDRHRWVDANQAITTAFTHDGHPAEWINTTLSCVVYYATPL